MSISSAWSASPAKLLRVHLCESDRFQGKLLYEAIVDKCRELKIAGATVFRGMEGYGDTAEIQRQPIVIQVADSAENIERILAAIQDMIENGLLAVSFVEMIRVRKK